MTMEPKPVPGGVVKPPAPPPPPPTRTFKDVFLVGLLETKESKQRTHDYEVFMSGYKAGRDSAFSARCDGEPPPPSEEVEHIERG